MQFQSDRCLTADFRQVLMRGRYALGWFRGIGVAVTLASTGLCPVWAAPFAYVANYASRDVSVIDTASNTVTTTISVGSLPYGVAINSGATRVYVSNIRSNSISVIDTGSNSVTATVAVGRGPWAVALNPAGTRAYVANGSDGTLSVIEGHRHRDQHRNRHSGR